MFDTSIVRAGAVAAPRRAGLLTASLVIHSAAVIGAVALSIASTTLPNVAPRQMEIFRTSELPVGPPPPLGNPGPRRQEPEARKPQVLVPRPNEVTPPAEVPMGTSEPGSKEPGTGDGPPGDPNGVPGGVGKPGGGGGTGPDVPDVIYQPTGGVITARVLTRVEPRFPQSMIKATRIATVIVLCVIDKQGRIRDPKIVMSSFPPFNQAVLDAVQQWTFEPGSYRGQAVDTYFELKVRFEVR